MNIASIVGIALVCAVIIVILRKNSAEFAVPASVIASIIILSISMVFATDIFKKIEEIAELSAVSSDNLKIVFKALGVCYITQIGRDICNDCGESALADKVDLAGKITIAGMSIGMITEVLTMITELVNK
ncbi:MAG: SpoIIIAC/SpoIIIAD family protein [Acutalibacteraceae bacterium]